MTSGAVNWAKISMIDFQAEVDMAVVKGLWIWWTTRTRMLLKGFKQSLCLEDVYNERFPLSPGGVVQPSLCIVRYD